MVKTLHLCLIEVTLEGFNVDVIAANGTVVFEYLVPAILELEETTTTTTTLASSTTTTREETTFFSFPGVILAIVLMVVVFNRRQRLSHDS